ncbi:hypothetical protein TWF225_008439 [Orbilia oligospora]|uniref:Uncharacterized protein n=1 Tax=Orbilia oligospora TaxID=2813651 RepID=A0A7C8P0Q2_ORBOL|nr:hypothetical protein TWF751_003520 [Orbilia oligospora]KAF3177455.1 hypothetical protein TWF225_008439 [Orbilia oligospora]KAF3244522.1 hypothetical protein TWF217_010761 [Orbilia oligospora]KAF3268167.1 hypothetical protein TWF128_008172 [Orbilia oligospora]KAF3295988.1 hypothetical protein TWF132_000530 [Orbilia oligospora]
MLACVLRTVFFITLPPPYFPGKIAPKTVLEILSVRVESFEFVDAELASFTLKAGKHRILSLSLLNFSNPQATLLTILGVSVFISHTYLPILVLSASLLQVNRQGR